MKKTLLIFALLFSSLSTTARADLNEAQRTSVRKSSIELNNSADAAEAVEKFKEKSPDELWSLLHAHRNELQGHKLPKVEFKNGDTIDFVVEHRIIPLKIISVQKQLIQINAKDIDLSQYSSWEEKLQAVISALPKLDSKSSFLKVLFPEAYADNSLLRVTGGGGVALGASLFAAGTVVAGVTGVGIILVFGALWREGICSDMSDDVLKCQRLKTILDRALIEKDDLKKSMLAQKAPPVCEYPKNSLSKEDDRDIFDLMKPLVSTYYEVSRKLPLGCGEARPLLQECMTDISLRARYLCFDLGNGVTNSFLPNGFKWPNSNANGTQPKLKRATVGQ